MWEDARNAVLEKCQDCSEETVDIIRDDEDGPGEGSERREESYKESFHVLQNT